MKTSNSHKYHDGYNDINSVPEEKWLKDGPDYDGQEKNIGMGTILIAKDGKWQHKNGDNNRILLFNQSNGNITGGGTRFVLQYQSEDSNKYIIREYSMIINEDKKYEHKTTKMSMYNK